MNQVIAFLFVLAAMAGSAQEIPLDNCRQLPIVKATVNKQQRHFLLDTGAASTLLNLKSFSSAETTEVTMESWSGAAATAARKVVLHDFSLGDQRLDNLELLAVDLTPLERSCQKRVDGVLGADMIARLGLTIDLKNHLGILPNDAGKPQSRLDELEKHRTACEQAFNQSDEKTLAGCLDPNIVLLTSHGEFHGRKEVMKHFKESYLGQEPPVLVALTPRSRQVIGPVIWMEYEMRVTKGTEVMKSRGTALYQKSGDRWLMSNMSFSDADGKTPTQ